MSEGATTSRGWMDTGKPLALIFSLALIVRLAYLLEVSDEPWFGQPVLDSQYVLNQARYLLEHGSLPPGPLFRPPLYTWYLAALLGVGGKAVVFFAPLVQYFFGAGFCVLMFSITRRCWSPVAGMVAGVLAALYSPLVFYETEILSDSLALFFYAAFIAGWLRGRDTGQWHHYCAAGALAGLGCITRPNLFICVAAFAAIAVAVDVVRGRSAPKRALGGAARSMGAFLLPVILLTAIPSTINYLRGDFNFIASQGGVNFWIGNHAEANGTNVIIPYRIEIPEEEYRDTIEEIGLLFYLQERYGKKEGFQLYHQDRNNAPKPSLLSKYWYGKGNEWLAQNPAAAVQLYGKKLVALVADYEIRNNRQFTFMRDEVSRLLKVLPVTMGWLIGGSCAGIVALLLAWFGQKRPPSEPLLWVLAYTFVIGISVLMFFVAGRLRLPILPGLFVLSGIGMVEVAAALRRRRTGALVALSAALALGCALSFSQWRGIDFRPNRDQPRNLGLLATSNYAMEWSMLGRAALAKGKTGDAIRYASKALEVDRDFAYAGLLIGDAAFTKNDLDRAGAGYRLAHENEPNSSKALNNLAVVAEKKGNYEAAASIYIHSLSLNFFHAPSLGNFATLLARTGMTTPALSLANRALTVDPANKSSRAVREELSSGGRGGNPEIEKLKAEVRSPLSALTSLRTPMPPRQAVEQAAPKRLRLQ